MQMFLQFQVSSFSILTFIYIFAICSLKTGLHGNTYFSIFLENIKIKLFALRKSTKTVVVKNSNLKVSSPGALMNFVF